MSRRAEDVAASEVRRMGLKVIESNYQRNGICGEGFNVVRFSFNDEGTAREMIAVLLNRTATHNIGAVGCFVMEASSLCESDWRGDHFYEPLAFSLAERGDLYADFFEVQS